MPNFIVYTLALFKPRINKIFLVLSFFILCSFSPTKEKLFDTKRLESIYGTYYSDQEVIPEPIFHGPQVIIWNKYGITLRSPIGKTLIFCKNPSYYNAGTGGMIKPFETQFHIKPDHNFVFLAVISKDEMGEEKCAMGIVVVNKDTIAMMSHDDGPTFFKKRNLDLYP